MTSQYCFNDLDVLLIVNPNKNSCIIELDGKKLDKKDLAFDDVTISKQKNGLRITLGEVENE